MTGPRTAGQPEVFEYAVLRVVPRVDRGEAINAGVLVYCRPLGYLSAKIDLDTDRLLALDPAADVEAIREALAAIAAVCAGPAPAPAASSASGPPGPAPQPAGQTGQIGQAGAQDIGRRFRWLTAPRSTVIQPGPVHTGLTRDPEAEAERLLQALVRRLDAPSR